MTFEGIINFIKISIFKWLEKNILKKLQDIPLILNKVQKCKLHYQTNSSLHIIFFFYIH